MTLPEFETLELSLAEHVLLGRGDLVLQALDGDFLIHDQTYVRPQLRRDLLDHLTSPIELDVNWNRGTYLFLNIRDPGAHVAREISTKQKAAQQNSSGRDGRP